MSWVAVATIPVLNAGFTFVTYKAVPHFQTCSYCQKAPDQDQKESNCRSCGAPLRKVEPTKVT